MLARIDVASGSVRQISSGNGIRGRVPPTGNVRGYNGEPFVAGKKYLYLFRQLDDAPKPLAGQLVQLDPETKQEQVLAEVPFSPRSAFLSRDGGTLYFSQVGDTKLRAVSLRGLLASPFK